MTKGKEETAYRVCPVTATLFKYSSSSDEISFFSL